MSIKELICAIKGHQYEFDKWQIYWKGHRHCQFCGKWEHKVHEIENKE